MLTVLLMLLIGCKTIELVPVYPKIPSPSEIQKPELSNWKFFPIKNYLLSIGFTEEEIKEKDFALDFVYLSVADSILLRDDIIDLKTYGKLLLSDVNYYKLATDFVKLDN